MCNSPSSISPICLAGAHRSGTSLLARMLHAAGLELGPESDLMPARPDNPDGFWENLRFVALNDQLLSELGGAWDLPPTPDSDFARSELDPLRARARALLDDFIAQNVTWGWKDPRNSLTLPFWKELLPNLKTLIVVRNPLEVAHSMRERNGSSHAFGLRLWEIYNRRVIAATAAEERLVTPYESFFENSAVELSRIAEFIGLSSSKLAEVGNLIVSGRRHTVFTVADMTAARVSPEVIELYRDLVREAKEGSSSYAAQPGTGPSDNPLSGAVSEVNTSSIEREVDTRARILKERDAYRERFLQTNYLLHGKSIALSEAEVRNASFIQDLRRQLNASKKLLRFLGEIRQSAGRLRESRRWKMANPLAWLKSSLSDRPLPGFGHLDRVLQRLTEWEAIHPEIAHLDDAIQALKTGGSGFTGSRPTYPSIPLPVSGPITFSVHGEVEVSIIIPVYNQFDFTQACLASIQQFDDGVKLEVIVVDDCSSEDVSETLRQNPGLVVLRNDANSGFIASCNRGAEQARASFLLFLNNDTLVTPGWVAALRDTFASEPTAGLVGSKLIYPDGRLQEAGGIIWQDASGWNRGKFQDPDKPEFNYLRAVDYCSAASVMIPKALFSSLGGFDAKYAPAYYEDTDLAFKVRAAGHKVLYQPLSKVIHYEGATGGTDLSAGTKQYQERNRVTFATTWASALAQQPTNGDVASWEALRPAQKRILVIDHHLPMPDRDSGSLRMSQILSLLHELGHRVTFIPDNLADIPPYGDALRRMGVEVFHYPYLQSVRSYLQIYGHTFDVVILSRCDFARKHVSDVREYAGQSRLIFDTVDLHFLRTDREADLTQNPLIRKQATEKEAEELRLIDATDETWVVSTVERDLVAQKRPGKPVHVVSNIVEAPGSTTPFSLRQDYLFIGSFQHTPNIDAVLFFAQEIYPLVMKALPATKFYIIGDKAPASVVALAAENVIVTGLQPEVRPYFDCVKLSVAPLRYGAGVKGKINQSMGLGVPVVGTTIAVEGMELVDHRDVLIADHPLKFADALIELYSNPALWEQISRAGVEKTRALFSREVAAKQLKRLFSEDGGPISPRPEPQQARYCISV